MRPLIIPIFLPNLGCREHCIFCNQRATAEETPSPSSVHHFIKDALKRLPSHDPRERQIAFYGGSFTALGRESQIRYLETARPFLASGSVDSLRVSTRPDAIDEEILSLLKEYGVQTVELGCQSMVDEVLFLSRRGHSSTEVVGATLRLKQQGFEVGLQLMIGLPGDSSERFLQSIDRVVPLKPDFLRIHPTLVLRGAPLETLWERGRYTPLSLREAIGWLKEGLLLLERSGIEVARVGLQPTRNLERSVLAGPYHPAIHQMVDSEIFFDMARHLLKRNSVSPRVLFLCHPKDISNLRGQRNGNLLKLREEFYLREILIQGQEEVPRGWLVVETSNGWASIERKDLIC